MSKYSQAQSLANHQAYTRWEWLIGAENLQGEKLTKAQLRKWSNNLKRELTCIFCGDVGPEESFFNKELNIYGCGRCREYKGLQPYIEGWSEPAIPSGFTVKDTPYEERSFLQRGIPIRLRRPI